MAATGLVSRHSFGPLKLRGRSLPRPASELGWSRLQRICGPKESCSSQSHREVPLASPNRPHKISPAEQWLSDTIAHLKSIPFLDIPGWPEGPAAPAVTLTPPEHLQDVRISLFKRTRPQGDIEVRLRCERLATQGHHETLSAGFTVSKSGALQDLGERELWHV